VVDLAKAHVIGVKRLLNKKQEKAFEIFNLGTGSGFSVLEVISSFQTVSGIQLKHEITTRRPGDVPQLFASTALAKEKLGWSAEKSLNEMISSSWKWEQNLRASENS
jgi:UDP-glucose 4-epimerase